MHWSFDGEVLQQWQVVLWKANLVEGHNEGSLLLLEQVDAFYGLRFKPMHDVDHQNGNVTETAAS